MINLRNKMSIYSAIGAVVILLSGCAAHNKMERNIEHADARANVILDKNFELRQNAVTVSDSLFVAGKGFRIKQRDRLPSVFEERITLNFPDLVSLATVIDRVSGDTGLKFYVTPGALTGSNSDSDGGSGGAMDSTMAAPSANNSGGGLSEKNLIVSYSGSLEGFLDVIAGQMNVFWKWEDNRIVIHLYETKTFALDVLPGTSTMQAIVKGNSDLSDSEGGASSGQSAGVEVADVDMWQNVSDTVSSMLSPGGRMAISPASGEVTVTDIPPVLRSMEQYFESTNREVSKQVMIKVEVYEVEANRSNEYGVDWSAVYDASSNLGFRVYTNALSGVTPLITGTILKPYSETATPNVFIHALSSQGKLSLVTTSSVMTMNGQPAPVQVMDEKAYLKEVSATPSETGETSYTLTPGTVRSGFSMTVLPRIMNNGEMMMQFAMELSTLNAIESFSAGESAIQLPERSVKHFLQRAKMRSGETLVLTGFQKATNKRDYDGVADEPLWFLGGKERGSRNKKTTVVLVTPYLLGR